MSCKASTYLRRQVCDGEDETRSDALGENRARFYHSKIPNHKTLTSGGSVFCRGGGGIGLGREQSASKIVRPKVTNPRKMLRLVLTENAASKRHCTAADKDHCHQQIAICYRLTAH